MPLMVCHYVGLLILLLLPSKQLLALEMAHITDHIFVPLYQKADSNAKILKTLATGTPFEILQRQNKWVRIRVSDGKIGWIQRQYLSQELPAQLVLLKTQIKNNTLAQDNEKLQKQLKLSKQILARKKLSFDSMAELQQEINQLKQTIQDHRTKIKQQQQTAIYQQQLQAYYLAQIQQLQQQINSYQQIQQHLYQQQLQFANADIDSVSKLELQQQIKQLQGQINTASQLLQANQTQTLPTNFIIFTSLSFILGIIIGIIWLDWQHRKRHGGFRI